MASRQVALSSLVSLYAAELAAPPRASRERNACQRGTETLLGDRGSSEQTSLIDGSTSYQLFEALAFGFLEKSKIPIKVIIVGVDIQQIL
jgi:hypothetical protein